MDAFREFLAAIPQAYLWIIGGVIAEVILQAVKRYLWKPDASAAAKAQKLGAAAATSFLLAIVAAGWAWPETATAFVGIFFSAIGYHETTDKLGVKETWALLTEKDPNVI